jgi:hypothetical protein
MSVGVGVGPSVGVEYMIVELASGMIVGRGVEVGAGGVYMAVCEAKKAPTIVPTTEVIMASGLSVEVASPVQAVKRTDAIRIVISILDKYFFIGSPECLNLFKYKGRKGHKGNSKAFLGINESTEKTPSIPPLRVFAVRTIFAVQS